MSTQTVKTNPSSQKSAPQISVVVPLGPRYEDLGGICEGLRRVLGHEPGGHEVVFVDDANGIQTRQALQSLEGRFPEVRVIRLQRRMGEASALVIGAQAAHGETLVILDPYLHVSLDDLPKLLAPLKQGVDLVCAWRWPRRERGLGWLASEGFNAAARWLTQVPVHDLNCRTRVLRRSVLAEMPLYGDLHRFLPIFAARRGYVWREIKVSQQAGKREVGAFALSSYVGRLLDLLTLAFLTRFVRRPLHFFGLIGLASFLVGAAVTGTLLYQRLAMGMALASRPLFLMGILLIVVGVQIASIGLLGELMIFTHAKDLKDYVVEVDSDA